MKESPLVPAGSEPSISERLTRVEERLDEISVIVARFSARAAAGDAPIPEESEDEPLERLIPRGSTVMMVLQQLGRSCLVLGGAFLIRAVTEAATVPPAAGAALGFAYAVGWIAAADRTARRGRALGASFLGITAIAIADPLLFEAATRFKVIGTAGAAVLLALFAILSLEVARRRALPVLAWGACVGAIASAVALSVFTGRSEPFAASLVAVGIATVWMAGSSRAWAALRWPAAAAADLLAAVSLARVGDSAPAAAPAGQAGAVAMIGAALAFPYLGTFAARALSRRARPGAFEALQSAAVLVIGSAIAIAAARGGALPIEAVAVTALVFGAAAYAAALGLAEREGGRGTAGYFGWLGIALSLLGTFLMLDSSRASFLWSALSLAALSPRRASLRRLLLPHAVVYALAAVWLSGLARASLDALFSPAGRGAAAFPIPALAALASAILGFAWLVRLPRADDEVHRAARAVFAVLVCLGACGAAAGWLRPLAGTRDGALDAGALAMFRTVILAATAVGAGAASRRGRLADLRWLAAALLVVGAVKILFEDVPAGRPATLFPAFIVFGTALVALARLLRKDRDGTRADPMDIEG